MSITSGLRNDIILPGPLASASPGAVAHRARNDVDHRSVEDIEDAFASSLERVMLAIVVTGAALFAAGLCRLFSGAPAQDGAIVFATLAIASGAVGTFSTITGLGDLCRLLRQRSKADAILQAGRDAPC